MGSQAGRSREPPGYYLQLLAGYLESVDDKEDENGLAHGDPDVFQVKWLVSSRKSHNRKVSSDYHCKHW
jgi:hypothetical protein